MANVTLQNVRKTYAGGNETIKGVSLTVENREFVVFVGPSGCGKSTLLRMIAGLEDITSGDLLIDGVRANEQQPAERGLAMVFQSYALYPHMTVEDNMGFALKLASVAKDERHSKVMDAARILQLEPWLKHKPGQLSGGQRQRVAIGRAIVRNPKVFLFDEPLSNLDAALRGQMRVELTSLHRKLGATTIYVTHDQIEAMTMADKIVVLRAGNVEQVGAPLELYHRPANLFVAGFIGAPKMNLLEARVLQVAADSVTVSALGQTFVIPVRPDGVTAGDGVTLGIRPEHLLHVSEGTLGGVVTLSERLGSLTILHVKSDDGTMLVVQTAGSDTTDVGAHVRLALPTDSAHLFRADGDALPHVAPRPLGPSHSGGGSDIPAAQTEHFHA
ncbi:nitrate/sulfonate/bicarbonate transporter ATP-binding protein [Ameyamaea chiangmaiensis NBRC 103196]|uniref:sn-glycerol-3-phosphate ABC transporter ATP-binding protein UgpC n=1 Tax=Ameyamaea chiangmaiensis TaxID=442969 RepID=A0A850PE98_9PROT|nr:sn-glycerol-3-phosphate ABC transporter ATP-binding protein UgpC [Ameyamaea chiangmaiensis]MBS4075689.1 sn-glycerol-3-phosphate ABC transporter ATP-binding protein UgpC [Ameyamaea chiangmaiensis]NVN40262.1 sn-glycerol-3-phosphate ABC transporter ATP-binding protein UgpC [Ameyamaea chiangmaiensis]GBQ70505.1 nitrate/sulfonate/bicarbonate transporter ATP-binding protein [Ameyamaea chiangmaiensis NBRC 103196]